VRGAIGVFVIKFVEASAFALSAALLTFFGFMHGESVGLAVTPTVAIAYRFGCERGLGGNYSHAAGVRPWGRTV
jgi:hypothetical protein